MNNSDKLQTIRTLYDNLNAHKPGANDKYYAESVHHVAPGDSGKLSPEQISEYSQGFITAFPDLKFELGEVVIQDNKAAAVWTGTGTHQGPLGSGDGNAVAPTNRKVRVPGLAYYEFKDGKIAAQTIMFDQVTLLSQIGVM